MSAAPAVRQLVTAARDTAKHAMERAIDEEKNARVRLKGCEVALLAARDNYSELCAWLEEDAMQPNRFSIHN